MSEGDGGAAGFQIPDVRLDADVVVDAAREKTGLRDFGDESFREALEVLLRSYEEEADLNHLGRFTQYSRIVDLLADRLRAQHWFTLHPEIEDEEIEAPLVIAGLARTGTTMFHRLVSNDPDWYAVYWYECRYPSPFAEVGSEGAIDWSAEDPRVPAAREEVQMILDTQPVLASIHPWDATAPDEEIMLLEHGFLSGVPESGANVPTYREWAWKQDQRPAYRYMRRILQFLQWQKKQSGAPRERWILKAPHHLGFMDVLFETFPGVKVVQTHRDPLQTIPSVASMYYTLWGLACDAPDPKTAGAQCLERWSGILATCLEQRARLGEEHFHDISFRAVQSDPLAQVRGLYEFLGRDLRPEVEAAMATWLEDNRRDKRAAHEYTMEEFGYTEAALKAAFADYRGRFITD